MRSGFTTTQYHRIKQAATLFQMIAYLIPAKGRFCARIEQMVVLTIDTAPRTALAKDHRGEFAWTCWSGGIAVEEWTDCGSDGISNRRARGELRGGVFYFGCA